MSCPLWGESARVLPLQQVGGGGGVADLDAGGVGLRELGSIVASLMAGSSDISCASLPLASSASSGVRSARILFETGCCVGESGLVVRFLFDDDLGGLGVVDLMGDGIDDGRLLLGIVGMLLDGSGLMTFLGLVYSVISD